MTRLVSQAEFARLNGWQRSYVTQLKQQGRLVMRDGKVDAEASLAQIGATEGGRPDVADRHQQDRQQNATSAATGGGEGRQNHQPPPLADLSLEKARKVRAVAEARIKAAEAEIREMERDTAAGRLIAKDVVDFVLNDYAATLRSLMETLADRLAPVIFPLQTLEETHAALAEAAENTLIEMSETMKRREQQGKEAN